jgi:hypothetical protein
VIQKSSVSASALLKLHEKTLKTRDTMPILGRGLKAGNDSFIDLDEVPTSQSSAGNIAKVTVEVCSWTFNLK